MNWSIETLAFNIQGRGGYGQQTWVQKPTTEITSTAMEDTTSSIAEAVSNRLSELSIAENNGQSHASVQAVKLGSVQVANQDPMQGQKVLWKPNSYGTVSGATETGNASEAATSQKSSMSLSKILKGNLLENFTVDNSTYSLAEIRATFYPKFENEKSDQEVHFLSCDFPHTWV